jgi:hypothetical protein
MAIYFSILSVKYWLYSLYLLVEIRKLSFGFNR